MFSYFKSIKKFQKKYEISYLDKYKFYLFYPIFKSLWHSMRSEGLKQSMAQSFLEIFRDIGFSFHLPLKSKKLIEVPIRVNESDYQSFREIFIGEEYDFKDIPWNHIQSFLDIGANNGMAALFFLSQCPLERMGLVEGNSRLAIILERILVVLIKKWISNFTIEH